MKIQSPAKINLFLEVCGKRADGYHNLNTLMCCIGLSDTIHLRFGRKGISLHCDHPDVPENGTNLAWRAARTFFDTTLIHDGIHIDIKKNIPPGAGLGGGSSNAGTVLKALNLFYDSPVSDTDLMAAAKSIGADVPFFIYGKPAVATGIGDILTPCDCLKSYPIILIYPSVSVSTAEVYKKLNLTLTKPPKKNTKTLFKLNWGQNVVKQLFNDLESTAIAICPEIQEAKESLMANGAAAALMTGSGSAVFGIYDNFKDAKKAYQDILPKQISKNRTWQLHLSHLVV